MWFESNNLSAILQGWGVSNLYTSQGTNHDQRAKFPPKIIPYAPWTQHGLHLLVMDLLPLVRSQPYPSSNSARRGRSFTQAAEAIVRGAVTETGVVVIETRCTSDRWCCGFCTKRLGETSRLRFVVDELFLSDVSLMKPSARSRAVLTDAWWNRAAWPKSLGAASDLPAEAQSSLLPAHVVPMQRL